MMANNHIATALTELQAEHDHLLARLAKVKHAIDAIRDAFHLPTPPRRAPRTNGDASAASVNGHGSLSVDTIRAALKVGPLTPGALAEQLQVPRPTLRYRIKQLEADGVVISTGATGNRRIALAGPAPAKEAPQRR